MFEKEGAIEITFSSHREMKNVKAERYNWINPKGVIFKKKEFETRHLRNANPIPRVPGRRIKMMKLD